MWLKPQGYAEIVSPDATTVTFGRQREEVRIGCNGFDTMQCAHCNSVTHIKARMRPEDMGGLCKQCMGLICIRCLDGPCVPWLKKMEIAEKRDRARRSYGL